MNRDLAMRPYAHDTTLASGQPAVDPRRRAPPRWPLAIGLLVLCATAQAMTFTVHDPCGGGNADICAPRILGRGPITEDDASKLRRLVDEHQKAKLGGFSGITLHSPGGNLSGGLALGTEIRRLKLNTIATAQFIDVVRTHNDYRENILVRRVECHSACVYAFAGGVKRTVEGAAFGVHQFASRTPNPTAESSAQVTSVVLRAYLQDMGVSAELLDIASMVPPQQLRQLSAAEIRSLKLDNSSTPTTRWLVDVSATGQPGLYNVKDISSGHRLLTRFQRQGDILQLLVILAFDPKIVGEDRLSQFPVGGPPDLHLEVDGRAVRPESTRPWTRQPPSASSNHVIYTASSQLRASLLPTPFRSFKISAGGFGRANSDVGFENEELGTDGLAAGLQLLQRAR